MKPCPHFLKRFAVLAAASLILSAVTLSASAAAAPVKYEEKRSTVTTVDGAQKKEDLAVTVEYQVGSTSIRAYTVEKDEVIGVSKDMWSLYGAFTSDWITDGTYTLSQPLNSVEQITVSVPYGDTAARTRVILYSMFPKAPSSLLLPGVITWTFIRARPLQM